MTVAEMDLEVEATPVESIQTPRPAPKSEFKWWHFFGMANA